MSGLWFGLLFLIVEDKNDEKRGAPSIPASELMQECCDAGIGGI